jgi:RNA polymerase sigma factor (sigma-70 family)
MQAMHDSELLREYALRNSEQAFATLVSRYIDMVYSAAFRHVANHHQAEEITQAVLVILARKAPALSPRTILAGWLFRTTLLTASNYLRAEIRRAQREQQSFMQSNLNEDRGDPWREVAPMLNDAIAGLRERDRNAIVLRFLQGKDYKAVAAALGGTEEAAQMRVGRALEKLRKLFAKRGVLLTATALGALMAAQGTQAAPLGLAASVTIGALQGATLTASTLTLVKGTLKLMAWTKLKFAAGTSVVLLLVYQYQQNTVQALHLTVARAELRFGKDTVAAQESRIVELEQQATAIVETRREQEQSLARLRARREAGPAGTQTKSVAVHAPTTLVSALLADPVAREFLREELVGNARNRLEPAVKELKLKSDAAEKLYQIVGDSGMRNVEAVVAFTEGKITAEAAVQTGAQADQEATNQVRLLVGEETSAKLEECGRSFPAQSLGEQFDRQLGFFGLRPEQRQLLRDLFASVPDEVAQGLAGDFTVRQLVYPEELDRRFAQENEANQGILQKAAALLDPNSVDALALMQAFNLAAHQRTALQILRKL